MSVHYKFKSALEYDTVTFDGLHISVKDLKKAIVHQKRIGKTTDFDLQVTNAQTKEVYSDDNALIPKNTSLVIARVPLTAQTKGKPWEGYNTQAGPQAAAGTARSEEGALSKTADLTQLDASEDDKIRAMMTQSTLDYDPSNYMKIRGSNQVGVVPPNYRCYKCHQQGHWIKDCPLGHGQDTLEIKKSTGIPRSFMVPVEGPMVPGAMMTPTGQYAVPALDHQAYNEGHKPTGVPTQEEKLEIPEDLLCTICKDLLTDAVMIPCCGNSFCDECIRTILLESEDHECPDCHEKEISPGTLIPNRFLRNSVSNFKNETGYHKRQQYRNASQTMDVIVPQEQAQNVETKQVTPEPEIHAAESTTAEIKPPSPAVAKDVKTDTQPKEEPDRSSDSQKPIISEADSTETSKTTNNVVKEEFSQEKKGEAFSSKEVAIAVEVPVPEQISVPSEDPPGDDTSLQAKQGQAITSVGSAVNHHRVSHHVAHSHSNSRNLISNHDNSNRHYPSASTSSYNEHASRSIIEERPGTPTVDEPGVGPPGYTTSETNYPDSAPSGMHPTATVLPPPQHMHLSHHMQGPPPQQLPVGPGPYNLPPNSNQQLPPGHFPPTNAPPPGGFRLPPPGHPDFNRAFPPRPVFDPTRPPVPFDPLRPAIHGGPPPGYPPFPPGVRPPPARYPPPRHITPMMSIRPPSSIIDDPLEAFNRMLREKDERDRRARQRRVSRSRSYSRSRSSSRSFSRSPRSRSRSPPPRNRHRSRTRSPPPRNRRTPRSRSRSFSISRSRSFSRSPSFRGSPVREYSPRRRAPSRYRSPVNRPTPPRYRYKDNRPIMDRDRDRMPDRDRIDRDRNDRERDRERNERDRDYHYYEGSQSGGPDYQYENNFDRTRQQRGPPLLPNRRFGGPPRKDYPLNEPFYQPPDMCPPTNFPPHNNRFNNRGPIYPLPPPLMGMKTQPPHGSKERSEPSAHRKYDDIVPPGIEQPPVPGFENQRYESRFPPTQYDRSREDGSPSVDRFKKTSPYPERDTDRGLRQDNRDYRDRPPLRDNQMDNRFDRKYSPSPDRRHKSSSPRRVSRDRGSSLDKDKSRRRRRDESIERDKDKRIADVRVESERKDKIKKDTSEDEKSRKVKDKKKKKEKKEAERKKKKERKEKKEQEKLKKAEEKKAKEVQETTEEETKKVEIENDNNDIIIKEESMKQEIKHKVEHNKLNDVKPKNNLYDDILSEGIDNTVVENYGKIDQETRMELSSHKTDEISKGDEEVGEKETSFDGIELQANEAELKLIDSKSKEMLAPVPEPSKWEIDEDASTTPEKPHPSENKFESKQVFERPSKIVTSEVIKRAENAIFAKAINAIRPIEIKKISLDRAKLYSGEKERTSFETAIKEPVKSIQITIPGSGWNLEDIPPPGTEPVKIKSDRSKVSPSPNKLSVKERLGSKVEELDRITKDDKLFERNRSRTLSPLSRRIEEGGRNVSVGERRLEIEERRRDDHRRHRYEQHDRERRTHRNERSKSRNRERDGKTNYRDRRVGVRKDYRREDIITERSRSKHQTDRRHDHQEHREHEIKERERKRSKERRSKSRSESKDRKDKKKKLKEKKHKKEKEKEKDKTRKHKDDEQKLEVKVESKIISDKKEDNHEPSTTTTTTTITTTTSKIEKAKVVDERRKPTLDEANFEPDYDLETESEKEDSKPNKVGVESNKKRERSKSRDKNLIPEIVKKRKTEDFEKKLQKDSSSTESSDSSSDEKRKKKHKKHKKKKSRKDTSSSSDSSDSDSSVEKKSKKRHKSSKKLKKKKKSKHK